MAQENGPRQWHDPLERSATPGEGSSGIPADRGAANLDREYPSTHETLGRARVLPQVATAGKSASIETTAHRFRAESRGRIYVASPISTYRTRDYERALGLIAGRARSNELIAARDEFESSEDWLERWQDIVRTIGLLVFFTDNGQMIGAGVLREITDAYVHGIPVLFLDIDTESFTDRFLLKMTRSSNRSRTAFVMPERKR